ncbi:MAG: hypothetical protein ABIH77_04785 [Pseudomonadota bacterium]|nr:hypothetical protein [Gammaproteobacteria bacterium]MBU1629025.1 hypothetical protein [Gammaproteobacteria bacterium]MBU2546734.1 hypothetical protein [Gammaproteobacteria bacterium]
MKKIEKLLAEKAKEREALIAKGAEVFAKLAIKFNLWQLDKKTAETELKAIAEKHKTM